MEIIISVVVVYYNSINMSQYMVTWRGCSVSTQHTVITYDITLYIIDMMQ